MTLPKKPLAVSRAKKKLPVELDWGPGIKKDRLAYINADEKALIQRFRKTKAARDYAGIPAYADDSASSKGVERSDSSSSRGADGPSGVGRGSGGGGSTSTTKSGSTSTSSTASGGSSNASSTSKTASAAPSSASTPSAASVGPSKAPNAAAQAASNAYKASQSVSKAPMTNYSAAGSTTRAPNAAAQAASNKLNATSNALKAASNPQSIQSMINAQPNPPGLQNRTWDTVLNTPYNTVFPERAPVTGVAQSFPGRPRPGRSALGVSRVHSGLDFATAPAGTPVTPTVPGTVVQVAKSKSAYGPTVQVMNTFGVIDRYALHKDQTIPVKVGDPVYPGTVLGVAGKLPGKPSNFSHLHYERITSQDPAYSKITQGMQDGSLAKNKSGIVGSTSSYSRKTASGVTDAELNSSTRDWAKSLGISQGEKFAMGSTISGPTPLGSTALAASAPRPTPAPSRSVSVTPEPSAPRPQSIPSPISMGMLPEAQRAQTQVVTDPRVGMKLSSNTPSAAPAEPETPAGYFSQFAMTENDIAKLKSQAVKDFGFSDLMQMQKNISALPGFMGPIARDQQRVASLAAQPAAPAASAPSVGTRVVTDPRVAIGLPSNGPTRLAAGNPETYSPQSAPEDEPVYSENPMQGSQNPMQEGLQVEDPAAVKQRQQKYAGRGATIGSVIAGPLGAIVGGTLGWQMGKTNPQQRQAIASNPQALNANVQSINTMVEERGGKGNPQMRVTDKGLKDVLTNPARVTQNPDQYTTLEQMLAALAQGIDPETGKPIT